MKKIMLVAMALLIGLASCVKDKQYPGIKITGVSYAPTQVTEYDDVTVSATITSFKAFTAKLFYVTDAEPTPVEMTEAEGLYTAVIPAQPTGTAVKFWIEAVNDEVTETSSEMSYEVGAVVIDYSGLRLNELNGHDKFIEIYNAGAEAVNMNGVTIYKDTEKLTWTGTREVSVEPGAFLFLFSEDVYMNYDLDTTLYMFHSGLSAKKNVRIELKTPAGETIDDFNLTEIGLNGEAYGYANNEAPASYSRNADGNWYYADATPNAVNVDGVNPVLGLEGGITPEPPTPNEPDYTNLLLNELNGDTKFIELYNMGDLDLELTNGMYIEKDDKPEPVWTADGTITVPAHGYVVLYSADVLADHPELEGTNYLFNSGLSGKKIIRIALFMADGTQLDEFIRGNGEYGATISNVAPKSYARIPDGGVWMLADPTPGEANPAEGEVIPQE